MQIMHDIINYFMTFSPAKVIQVTLEGIIYQRFSLSGGLRTRSDRLRTCSGSGCDFPAAGSF